VRGLFVLALLAFLGRASAGRADDVALPLDLSWSAASGCASADEIRAELAKIARVRAGRSVARLAAQGRIDKRGATYVLHLRTERNGQIGERSLAASECRSLAREVTLVLAVAFGEGVEIVEVEPSVTAGATQRDVTGGAAAGSQTAAAREAAVAKADGEHGDATLPKPQVAAENTPAPADSPAPPSAAASDSQANPLRGALFLGGGVLFSTLPAPAALVVAGGELGWRRLWFEARLVWLPGVADSLERSVQARYTGFGGALAACIAVPPYAASLNACLGAEATALRGRTAGPSESGTDVAPWLASVISVAWQWPAEGMWTLRLEAQLHIALNQPRFVVEGLDEVHSVPRFAPSFAATLALWPSR
jgi:hypothetical protein